ncbi:MAG: hypothetical protein ACLQVY_08090 [Limisphaerales bacterium]
MIYLAYVGAAELAAGLVLLGAGLIKQGNKTMQMQTKLQKIALQTNRQL